MKNIFVCTTFRHILTALMMSKGKESYSTLIIFSDHQNISEDQVDFRKIRGFGYSVYVLNENEMFQDFISRSLSIIPNIIKRNYSINSFISARKFIKNKLKENGIIINNDDDIFIFHDRNFISKYFLSLNNVILVEDGKANYYRHVVNNRLKKVFRVAGRLDPNFYYLGESKRVKKLLLFEEGNLPPHLSQKVENLSSYLSYDSELVNRLKDVFFVNIKSNSRVIFFTQGLDVAGLCTKQEKLLIYRTLIEKLIRKFDSIVIKTHPSEEHNEYADCFSGVDNIYISKEKFPAELLGFLLDCDTKYISLFTSTRILTSSGNKDVINLINDQKNWIPFKVDNILDKAGNNIEELF